MTAELVEQEDNLYVRLSVDGEIVELSLKYVKPYTRMVKGHTQQVSGYYYESTTGLKFDPEDLTHAIITEAEPISHTKVPKMLAQAMGVDTNTGKVKKFTPGLYKVQLTKDQKLGKTASVDVHKDGSSITVIGPKSHKANTKQTQSYLTYWSMHGNVTKLAEPTPEIKSKVEPTKPQAETYLYDILGHSITFPGTTKVYATTTDNPSQVWAQDHAGHIKRYTVPPAGQGVGLQAVSVASTLNLEQPGYHLLVGSPVVGSTVTPGTTTVGVGGVEVTSIQLTQAINRLNNMGTGVSVKSALLADGSPLATADIAGVSAPYLNVYGNDQRLAFLHVLKIFQKATGVVFEEKVGSTSHLVEQHKVDLPHVDIGAVSPDLHKAIHDESQKSPPGLTTPKGKFWPAGTYVGNNKWLSGDTKITVHADGKAEYGSYPSLIIPENFDDPKNKLNIGTGKEDWHLQTDDEKGVIGDEKEVLDALAQQADEVQHEPGVYVNTLGDQVTVLPDGTGSVVVGDYVGPGVSVLTKEEVDSYFKKYKPEYPWTKKVDGPATDSEPTVYGVKVGHYVDNNQSEHQLDIHADGKIEMTSPNAGTSVWADSYTSSLNPVAVQSIAANYKWVSGDAVSHPKHQKFKGLNVGAYKAKFMNATAYLDANGKFTVSPSGQVFDLNKDGSYNVLAVWKFDIPPIQTVQGLKVGQYKNSSSSIFELKSDGSVTGSVTSSSIEMLKVDLVNGLVKYIEPESYPEPVSEGLHLSFPFLDPITNPQELDTWIHTWATESGYPDAGSNIKNNTTKLQWLKYWANGDWHSAYKLEAKFGTVSDSHPGATLKTKKLMAPLIAGEVAAGQPVPGFIGVNTNDSLLWSEQKAASYLVAAHMANPTGLTTVEKLDWVLYHGTGNKLETDRLSLRAQKRVSDGDIKSPPLKLLLSGYPPGVGLPVDPAWASFDPTKKYADNLTPEQTKDYLSKLGPDIADWLTTQSLQAQQAVVQMHWLSAISDWNLQKNYPSDVGYVRYATRSTATDSLKKFIDKIQEAKKNSTPFPESIFGVPAEHKFKRVSSDIESIGTGSHWKVVDENGKSYIFKVAKEKFRAEAEDSAQNIAKSFGYQVAGSRLGEFEGQYGQFQNMIPNSGMVEGIPPSSLSDTALIDVAKSHPLDWMMFNDDAHNQNFLVSEDGSRVTEIDLGRSFAQIDVPGAMTLKPGSLSNWSSMYVDSMYSDIKSGQISDSRLDTIYTQVIRQARSMSRQGDGPLRQELASAFAHRPGTDADKARWTTAVLDRKATLEADFQKLYSDLYKARDREPPEIKDLGPGIHTGLSPEYLQAVHESGQQGVSTFYAGTDLEDGHLITNEVLPLHGDKPQLWLQGQLRKQTDERLVAWLDNKMQEGTVVQNGKPIMPDIKYGEAIQEAAKMVNLHYIDKKYDKSQLDIIAYIKKILEQRRTDATAGKYPDNLSEEDRAQYKEMLAQFFHTIIDIQQAKEAGISVPGLAKEPWVYKPAPAKLANSPESNIKVNKTSYDPFREMTKVDDNGNLRLNGTHETAGIQGVRYDITLPDGTRIEYQPWHSSVYKAQQGTMIVKVRNHDGTTMLAENALGALRTMGLDLQEADEADLELLYWRSLYKQATTKSDAQTLGYTNLITASGQAHLRNVFRGDSPHTKEKEIELWHKVFSLMPGTDKDGVDKFVADRGYLPQLGHPFPRKPKLLAGRPYWYRPDVTHEQAQQKNMPMHSIGSLHGSDAFNKERPYQIVTSGKFLPSSERPRVLGRWIEASSASSDQDKGSGNVAFLRQNLDHWQQYQIYLNPDVMRRTSTYAFADDKYGAILSRSDSAHFDFDKMTSHSGLDNEAMVKYGASLLDDMELVIFNDHDSRQRAIDFLHDQGITEIRGLPIEDRLRMTSDRADAIEQIDAFRLGQMGNVAASLQPATVVTSVSGKEYKVGKYKVTAGYMKGDVITIQADGAVLYSNGSVFGYLKDPDFMGDTDTWTESPWEFIEPGSHVSISGYQEVGSVPSSVADATAYDLPPDIKQSMQDSNLPPEGVYQSEPITPGGDKDALFINSDGTADYYYAGIHYHYSTQQAKEIVPYVDVNKVLVPTSDDQNYFPPVSDLIDKPFGGIDVNILAQAAQGKPISGLFELNGGPSPDTYGQWLMVRDDGTGLVWNWNHTENNALDPIWISQYQTIKMLKEATANKAIKKAAGW